MRLIDIPYQNDSADLFERLADEPWAVFLDSGPPAARQGRFDILSCAPYATLTTVKSVTDVDASQKICHTGDPFAILTELLGETPRAPGDPAPEEIPFAGGALGYFGYDLGRDVNGAGGDRGPSGLPDLAAGLYDWAVVVDHQRQRSRFVVSDRAPDAGALAACWLPRLQGAVVHSEREAFTVRGPLRTGFDLAAYRVAVERIQEYIRAGDCYQVNLAQRFSLPVGGDPWQAYRALRQVNPAPYSAYLNLPQGQILSCSPEQFLAVARGQVLTRPIKGTRPRHANPDKDAGLARELVQSLKDRAENLMIVDLLRNDLGRVCRPGSIVVEELFKVESFARVHHLVSTVRGELDAGRTAADLLRAAFPGGSITGAPKQRAMQIIDELERAPRGVYCGAIAWLGYDGTMDSNVAIRTLTWQDGELVFWAGGGIVADSDWVREYQECRDKAAAILDFLQMHGLDAGDCRLS